MRNQDDNMVFLPSQSLHFSTSPKEDVCQIDCIMYIFLKNNVTYSLKEYSV